MISYTLEELSSLSPEIERLVQRLKIDKTDLTSQSMLDKECERRGLFLTPEGVYSDEESRFEQAIKAFRKKERVILDSIPRHVIEAEVQGGRSLILNTYRSSYPGIASDHVQRSYDRDKEKEDMALIDLAYTLLDSYNLLGTKKTFLEATGVKAIKKRVTYPLWLFFERAR